MPRTEEGSPAHPSVGLARRWQVRRGLLPVRTDRRKAGCAGFLAVFTVPVVWIRATLIESCSCVAFSETGRVGMPNPARISSSPNVRSGVHSSLIRLPTIFAVMARIAHQMRTPPMGWNSWNSGMKLTERSVKETIDAIVSSGMRDAGYRYVILDAGWAAPTRDASGRLHADPVRFPNGIAAVTRYAHDRDLLFGLYSSPYNEICGQGRSTASAGHELTDARQFAEWQVDYLKYDWCRVCADHDEQVRVFTAMRDALRATGRRIFYSINPNSSSDDTAGQDYDWSEIADMVRTSGDLVPVWQNQFLFAPPDAEANPPDFLGVTDYFALAAAAPRRAQRDYWTDPDMLVVGVTWSEFVTNLLTGLRSRLATEPLPPERQKALAPILSMTDEQVVRLSTSQSALTETEQRTHFSLWAMLAAPLIAGNDVRTQSQQTRAILTNRDVIAIDQDPLGEPATPLRTDIRIWIRPLSDGSTAVAFFNPAEQPASFAATATELGLQHGGRYIVRDLWSHAESTTIGNFVTASVPPHGVVLLRITPQMPAASAVRPETL